ncbi:unnamed protein product [Parascedosporium putredinis]|uniref:Oxysterol-binding protein n=1 Tax=Parascedosporium putredinis TaxID=1442378 RepID=A0A9P1GUI5_9PEZI|nr:unnamed protein product [Parascedosporium putredinis]CAI7987892.1 unnamed protein product [Parascedosporium putredinis]
MSDVEEHNHKYLKSASPLTLLRGNHRDPSDIHDLAHSSQAPVSSSSDPTLTSKTLPTMAQPPSQASLSHHSSKPSISSTTLARSQSTHASPPRTSIDNKAATLEQSVRKFRIVEALRNGDTASISKALRDNAEGGSRTSISSISGIGGGLQDTTILHLAIQCAEYPVVEYILSNGAGLIDINARDKDGNTPLHIASGQGRTPIVRLLLEQEAINDAIANHQGRLPIDISRNPEIFQQLQLARSLFTEAKVHQIQELVNREDYGTLKEVLEESRLKTVLDINSSDFVSDPATLDSGGTMLHEAARKKNSKLIQILLLHGADPFRRDRKGKLPQDVTKDDVTRAMLKRSPAAVAAQRGIQEKAVLGHAASQGASSATAGDPLVGREAREMKGYLKRSACRGAINMRIARLHMSADEKTKFEIIGKSSVKYTLKANHEVEAKRWFWALNNSIQWTKDQAREEERQKARAAELLKLAKADRSGSSDLSAQHSTENLSVSEANRSSVQINRGSISKVMTGASTIGSIDDDAEEEDAATDAGLSRLTSGGPLIPGDLDDDDDDDEDASRRNSAAAASKDALNITAQSARIQLETISAVNASLMATAAKNPQLPISDPAVSQALSTYDGAIRTLTELVGSLLKISKDRDSFWQYRFDREVHLRRMWEESMAKVAREQEALEAKFGEAEMKRRLTKKALREAMIGGTEAVEDEGPEEDAFEDAGDGGSSSLLREKSVVVSGGIDISSSFKGYENGIRKRLKMDADDRPKISLWGILKSMIGKDMTKMTLPVSFNEPTSLLYRCGEDMEYADLLDLAAERSDSIERLLYVSAFAASEYASTIGRVAKPFNPLLGETFEVPELVLLRRVGGQIQVLRQVIRHQPLGDVVPQAPTALGGKEDLYTWKKVTSSVIGIITGNPTVDNYGPMEVKNWTTGEICYIDFKPRGWKASSAYQISGKIVDASGHVCFSLGGRWNSKLYARRTPGYEAKVDEPADNASTHRGSLSDPSSAFLIWKANPRPSGIPFNLTPFVLTFNHIDDNLRKWIAPTDSRLRPDQRAMEDGEYDLAATEKNRLEEAQRARRRIRESQGEEFVPAWFTKARCEITGEEYWKFNGEYWERRAKFGEGDETAWDGLEPVFEDCNASAPPRRATTMSMA